MNRLGSLTSFSTPQASKIASLVELQALTLYFSIFLFFPFLLLSLSSFSYFLFSISSLVVRVCVYGVCGCGVYLLKGDLISCVSLMVFPFYFSIYAVTVRMPVLAFEC